MQRPLITVEALAVRLPDGRRLGPLSFALGAGECLGVVGGSGSGKSLLAQALVGLLPAGLHGSGRLQLAARDDQPALAVDLAANAPPPTLRGRGIGYLFQDAQASLHPLRTIGSQLLETLRVHGSTRAGARAEAERLLAAVGLPARAFAAPPHRLSGGQRQRALIALALAPRPALLVADESTSALDALVQQEILDLLAALRREHGLGLLFIGHDLAVVAALADQLCVLDAGRVVEQGPRAALLAAPTEPYTRALLAAQRPPAGVAGPPLRAPLLRAHRLSVRYPGAQAAAVDAVDLELAAGEVLALVGESGSGKSTLGRALLGLQPITPDSRLEIAGQAIGGLDAARWKALRRRIQVVFQDPYGSLDPRQTAGAIIREPRRIHRLPVEPGWLTARLAEVGLDATAADRYPRQFSGGQRQRIAIARALACDPDLLVCDEAVSALDALVRQQILALLAELRQRRGLALLFITHDLELARRLADRIAVMQAGRIVEQGEPQRLFLSPVHPFTRALLAVRRPTMDATSTFHD